MIHGGWPRWTRPARIEHDTPIVPQAVAVAVYQLYGLTEEEIRIVEGESNRS
jgi:hypothetical protein